MRLSLQRRDQATYDTARTDRRRARVTRMLMTIREYDEQVVVEVR